MKQELILLKINLEFCVWHVSGKHASIIFEEYVFVRHECVFFSRGIQAIKNHTRIFIFVCDMARNDCTFDDFYYSIILFSSN